METDVLGLFVALIVLTFMLIRFLVYRANRKVNGMQKESQEEDEGW